MATISTLGRPAEIQTPCVWSNQCPTERFTKTVVGEYCFVADLHSALAALDEKRGDLKMTMRLMVVPGHRPPFPEPMPSADPAGGVLDISADGTPEALVLVKQLIAEIMK